MATKRFNGIRIVSGIGLLLALSMGNAMAAEDCSNGVDDDDDGFIDVIDPECATHLPTLQCVSASYQTRERDAVWDTIDLSTPSRETNPDDKSIPLNSIGYNQTDDRIWGVSVNNNQRLFVATQLASGTWSVNLAPSIASLPSTGLNAGDVNPAGQLFLARNGGSDLYSVDVNPGSPTYLQHLSTISILNGDGEPTDTGVHDFAFSPIDGMIYGIEGSTGSLIQINPATGLRTNAGTAGAGVIVAGATYFDVFGNFYAVENSTGKIFQIDLTSGLGGFDSENTTLIGAFGRSGTNDGARCSAAEIPDPSIRLYKTISSVTTNLGANTSVTDAGDTITYAFEITNTGNETLSNIAVTDTMLGTPITCAATTLDPSEVTTCTAPVYTITLADMNAGFVSNSASVTAIDTLSGSVSDTSDAGDDTVETRDGSGNTDSDPTNDPTIQQLAQLPRLQLSKAVSAVTTANGSNGDITDPGDEISYGFTVLNTGNVSLTNLAVTDAKVANINCAASSLIPGASTTCAGEPYEITVADMDAGYVQNSATATANDPSGEGEPVSDTSDAGVGNEAVETPDATGGTDEDPTNDPTVQHLTQVPALQLTKVIAAVTSANGSNGDITDAGDEISYNFSVLNTGNVTLSNLAVTDAKVANINCAASSLIPGASTTCAGEPYAITVADMNAGYVQNSATATANDPSGEGEPVSDTSDAGAGNETVETPDGLGGTDEDPGNDPTVQQLTQVPALQLTKVISAVSTASGSNGDITDAGDQISYGFTVLNTGNVTLTNLAVTDAKVANISCAESTLAPGASTTCSGEPYEITVADMNAGYVQNSATATANDPSGEGEPVSDTSDAGAGNEANETPDGPGGTDEDPTNDPTVQLLTQTPELRVTKTSVTSVDRGIDVNNTDAGDVIDYTFTVMNTGNVSVTNVAITDPVVGPVICTPTTLDPYEVSTCTANPYVVTVADVAAGYVENSALGSALPPSGPSVSDISDAGSETEETPDGSGNTDDNPTNDPTVTAISGPVYDLALIMTLARDQSPWVVQGSTIDYVVTIKNQGTVPSGTFTVVDTVPTGLRWVSGTGTDFVCTHDGAATGGLATCVYTPRSVRLPSGATELAPGDIAQLNIQLRVEDMSQATYVNWAEISADSAADHGVSDVDSSAGSHNAADDGPGDGTYGADPVVDHNDIDHASDAYDDPVEDEDDSDPAIVQVASSTPITLQSFAATSISSGEVAIRFTTSTEEANIGFRIYGRIRGSWRNLTSKMIVAEDNATNGAIYELTVQAGEATEFALADIDIFGKETPHGPFELGRSYGHYPVDKTPLPAANPDAVMAPDSVSNTTPDEADNVVVELANDAAYLKVRKSGIQRVGVGALRRAGVDLTTVRAESLALSFNDEPVALWIGDETGRTVTSGLLRTTHKIEFLAEHDETLYRRAAVYLLQANAEEAVRAATGRPIAERYVGATWRTAKWAPNVIYSRISPLEDAWSAARLVALDRPARKALTISVDDLHPRSQQAARLSATVWGANDDPNTLNDHTVVVRVNGELVARKVFSGFADAVIEGEVAPGILKRGKNRVEILAVNQGGADVSTVMVESVEIDYPAITRLTDNVAEFNGHAPGYRVNGVSSRDASVWRVEADDEDGMQYTRIRPAFTRNNSGLVATFAGSDDADAVHHMAVGDGIGSPQILPAPQRGDLVSGPAEYLIIAHPTLMGEYLNLLADTRRADDQSVKIVNVNWIYRANSSGNVDADAIRDYIAWAHENLGTKSVLLVGGDTYDPKLYLKGEERGNARSLIPTLYAPSAEFINHAPADPLFGDVDGDGVPEVAIGRFPVQTKAEVQAMVEKTLQYAQADYGNRAVFMTDTVDDGSQRSFARDGEHLISLMPPSWNKVLFDIDSLGAEKARRRLMTRVRNGAAITTWIGHSDQNVWSFSQAFNRRHVTELNNDGKPTVVTQFGCWNSYFVDPKRQSMAHYWLLNPREGAAAVMGASTLTDAQVEVMLAERLNRAMIDDGLPLGQALVRAKRELADEYPADWVRDVLSGYLLLGDPGLKLPGRGN